MKIVKLYGQCGGAYYNGPSNCEKGSYCLKESDLFSQCVSNDLNDLKVSNHQKEQTKLTHAKKCKKKKSKHKNLKKFKKN